MIKSKIISVFIAGVFLLSGCGQEAHNLNHNPSIETPKLNEENLVKDPTLDPAEEVVSIPDEQPAAKGETPVNPAPPATPAETENKSLSWYLKPNLEHTIPVIPASAQELLNEHQGFYIIPDDGSSKIYLTFDEGYELGYTPQILDTLQAHNIKATFFITGHYIKSQPELVKRMVNEGHMVANHTWNHPNLAKVTPEKLATEITSLAEEFEVLTNTPMAKYIRPPEGAYSETSLSLTGQLGYKTVFWSLAFNDWDPNKQPGQDFSYKYVMDHIHPGAVILLHAVSQSNTEALNDIITDLQKEGYVFALFE